MKNDSVGSLGDLPNSKYKKFFDSFNECDTLEPSNWKIAHLAGYFCKLYKNKYGVDYKWKFNSESPSKCYEVFQIKRLGQNLTTDPAKLKRYIDWAFEEKAKLAKRRITSIAFLNSEYLLVEYKTKYLAGDLTDQRIDRTTMIPPEYLIIINKFGYELSNYGELSFLLQMSDPKITELSSELSDSGLNLDDIKKIV